MIEVLIDGRRVAATAGESLLDCASRAGIAIPRLCHTVDNTPDSAAQPHKQDCNLCVVEICGHDTDGQPPEIAHACKTQVSQGLSIITHSAALSKRRQAALQAILSDHFADCEAPCQRACPAGVDVQQYLHHIAQGDHQQAVKVIKQTLPLPLSIGRVCPAFCESECRRGLIDEPLAIRQLKRHAADLDLHEASPWLPERAPATGKKIAIIGAGPAGLSAGYFLSNQGHEVSIFDSAPKAGGWLRYGIPEYRLPKAILDKEIELLCRNGLNIQTNTRLGKDIHLNGLVQDYDAVCLAIGAQKAVPMNYPGSDLEGCYLGVDYLRDYCTDKHYRTGKKVAVIGGGNTAIDCARTAVRDGADVTLIYRRTKEDMPAEPYEIHEAEVEGVKFHFLTNPLENHAAADGRVNAITFAKMALGEADASGRRAPIATGDTFTEDFDTVIAAVSQMPDMEFLKYPESQLSNGELALTRWNTFAGCEHTMSAGVEKLFVIGDSRTGPATAVAAIGDGRRAAEAIHQQLSEGLTCNLVPKQFNAAKASKTSALDGNLYPGVAVAPRLKMPELSPGEREHNFAEVELGFATDAALAEAARCLECACQANQQCDLRDYASEYRVDGEAITNSAPDHARRFAVDNSAPFISFDANRCISCGACVEMCQRQSGHMAIAFEKDCFSALPTAEANNPALTRRAPRAGFAVSMADANCVQCGNCVQVCPTGALVDKRDKSQSRGRDALEKVSTVCTYCGVGCRVEMHVDKAQNRIMRLEGDSDSPVNAGMLCVKGRYGFDFIQSKERLTSPLIRRSGELVEVSWEEAIDFVANKLSDIKARHGSDAIATLASAKATNEDNFLLQKFTRSVLGTNNIDHCARLCHASTVSALYDTLGSGAMTNDIPGIDESDLIFILGSDTSCAHPIIASHIRRVVASGKARLVVVDPKRVEIADSAELYLAQRPGTDVMLLNAIMQQILLNGWQDEGYIAARTEDFELVRGEVLKSDYSLANAATITGIAAEDIATLARLIGTAQKTAIYYAMGITQHTSGHDNVLAISNLQLMLGNIGVAGAGINPLRGQSNVQGSCDMGALPNYLPGYQRLVEPKVRAPFEAAWGTTLPAEEGLPASYMMKALAAGKLKAMYIMGENPVLSDADQAHVLEGLAAAELVVVQDIFLTETAALADVVLPAAAFAEKRGHFTNTERRVQQLQAVVKAPGSAKADWQIVQALANAMGADWHYDSEEQIWAEVNALTPQYRGIGWQRLSPATLAGKQGLQWPCPEPSHPGTPILHQHSFIRGLGRFQSVSYRLPAEMPCDEYPLVLSTGRLLEQFHTGTLTRKTEGLDLLAKPRVMMSVFDAERLGVSNGDMLKLTTRRGDICIRAFVTRRAQAGVLFLPFHFAEAAANKLTNNALDPVAHIPEYKFCAVRAEKIAAIADDTALSA